MPKLDPEIRELRRLLFENTSFTTKELSYILNDTESALRMWYNREYSKEFRKARKRYNYRRSKLGDKNPMFGKTGEQHHYYKGSISDCKGYRIILKPAWYTGRTKSKHIFEHHKVYCEDRGLTEVPEGYHIHHLDENKENNAPENLIMLSAGDHNRLHNWLKKNVSKD